MNAVSRFDAYRVNKRWRQAVPQWAPPVLVTAGAIVILFFAFQLFFRYQYLETNGTLWRIDRLTQHTCRMDGAGCVDPGTPKISGSSARPKFSKSTSTSTSTSTSVSLKPSIPKKH